MMILVLGAAACGMAMLPHGETTPPALPLAQFPKQIAGYSTVGDYQLDKNVLEILRASDYVTRTYYEPGVGEVGLYIAYFATQRSGAAIHSPKNCLPGAGWQPEQSSITTLQLDDGRKVPVNLYVIRKGLEQQVVLYWYQSHGRVIASEYAGRFYMVYDALRLNRTDAALIRITAPVVGGDEAGAKQRVFMFAKQVTPDVEKIIR
jgi:EpsI family protein